MGESLERVSAVWDEAVQDFLEGKPSHARGELGGWLASYRRRGDVQLEGFPEPFLGPLDRTPKMAFLALNPGEVQPSWQHLEFEGRPGTFVDELRAAGSYTKWAAEWSYLAPAWQGYIAKRRGPNHHGERFDFMRNWYGDSQLTPQDRVDFELYPWHSHRFAYTSLDLPACLPYVRRFVWEPLTELEAPVTFAFGAWWWKNLEALGVQIVARLGHGGEHPFDLGYKADAKQSVVVGRLPHGGVVIAEKHGGGPPNPPMGSEKRAKTERFRSLVEPWLPK